MDVCCTSGLQTDLTSSDIETLISNSKHISSTKVELETCVNSMSLNIEAFSEDHEKVKTLIGLSNFLLMQHILT